MLHPRARQPSAAHLAALLIQPCRPLCMAQIRRHAVLASHTISSLSKPCRSAPRNPSHMCTLYSALDPPYSLPIPHAYADGCPARLVESRAAHTCGKACGIKAHIHTQSLSPKHSAEQRNPTAASAAHPFSTPPLPSYSHPILTPHPHTPSCCRGW